ncbi:MAG: hypothetical protein ACRDT0_21365 [Pseudonocardiaceae bacterium]
MTTDPAGSGGTRRASARGAPAAAPSLLSGEELFRGGPPREDSSVAVGIEDPTRAVNDHAGPPSGGGGPMQWHAESALALSPELEPEPEQSRVPDLEPDTPMQKVVLPGLVDLLLGNVTVPGRFDPHRIAGFVTRLQDVPAGTSGELASRYGLDQVPGWPPTTDLHVLRFYAHHPMLFLAPFDRNVYQLDLLELPAGTELWRIDSEGAEQRVGAYLHRQIGWVGTTPLPLGPGRWGTPPAPLRPSVRRGLVARYRGGDFDADFGPQPGEVTLHPLPGRQAPEDFTEQVGTLALAVPVAELDSLALLRWRTSWRGLPVEMVESGPEHAIVHYLGEDGQRATDLGLAEVDYRVWRGPVPRRELDEVCELRSPVSA